VKVANAGLAQIRDVIAAHPNDPGFTKEQAIRTLMVSIEGRRHQEYKRSAAYRWAALTAIVTESGGCAAFQDAQALPWTMTMIEHESDYVKVLLASLSPLTLSFPP
jgi:hypothetical protein